MHILIWHTFLNVRSIRLFNYTLALKLSNVDLGLLVSNIVFLLYCYSVICFILLKIL